MRPRVQIPGPDHILNSESAFPAVVWSRRVTAGSQIPRNHARKDRGGDCRQPDLNSLRRNRWLVRGVKSGAAKAEPRDTGWKFHACSWINFWTEYIVVDRGADMAEMATALFLVPGTVHLSTRFRNWAHAKQSEVTRLAGSRGWLWKSGIIPARRY